MAGYGKITGINEHREENGGDGYSIWTTVMLIEFWISNERQCCESWGYFSSDDDLSRFIGKEIDRIELDSEKCGSYEIPEDAKSLDCGGIRFITVHLADGDSFQLAVYNAHNGFYGHDIGFRIGGMLDYTDCI